FPRGIPGALPDQLVYGKPLLLLERLRDGGRAWAVKPVGSDGPAALLHLPLPAAQVVAVGVVARHGLLGAGLGAEVPTPRQREHRCLRSRLLLAAALLLRGDVGSLRGRTPQ